MNQNTHTSIPSKRFPGVTYYFQEKKELTYGEEGSVYQGYKIENNPTGNLENPYQLEKFLEKGSEGEVNQGTIVQTDEKVTIKISELMTDNEKQILEIRIQKEFKHIINISDLIQAQGKYIVVMDFADGEFFNYMNQPEYLSKSKKEKNELFYQIVCGVSELHSLGLIHRDLKPENVVFIKQGQQMILKLCDFGLAKQKQQSAFMTMNIGSPYYQAPELLTSQLYTEKIDIWALGMIWFEMIVGQTMLNGRSAEDIQIQIKELNDQKIEQMINSSNKFEDGEKRILSRMINMNPNNRMTADQLKKYFEAEKEIKLRNQKNIDNLLQQQLSQSEKALNWAKSIFERLSVDIEKQLQSYKVFGEFKQFEILRDSDQTFTQLKNELTELENMYAAGLNDQNLLRIKRERESIKNCSTTLAKQSDEILIKINDNQKLDLEQLRVKLEYCTKWNIQVTEFNRNIDNEIKRLKDEKQQLLNLQSELRWECQNIEQLYKKGQHNASINAADQFIQLYESKQIFDKFEDEYQLLQKYLRSFIVAKSLTIIIKLYHVKRFATRLKKDLQRDKNRNTTSAAQLKTINDKDQKHLKDIQTHLTFESEKTKVYEDIVQNLELKFLQAEINISQFQQDLENIVCLYKDLLNKIQTKDRIKLRALVNDQKVIKDIVEYDIPVLELKEMLTFEKIIFQLQKQQ